jgi:branched-chain amino acid transport system ATP-binding protein
VSAVVRLAGVSKAFGALSVVDDLSLALGVGEVLGILGPNGAGKSTLFNLITGDLAPSKGAVFFREREITHLPPHLRARLGIARSYQIPHPFAKMTVFENLLVGAAFGRGWPEARCYDACLEVLELTGLAAKANAPAGTLTLLERKQLELARALATGPSVLLLDEIAGGLTESECRRLVATIRAVNTAGTAIIWIEHVVHALLAVVQRLTVINFGRVLADGAPEAVMRDPAVREVYLGLEVG